MRIQFPNGVFLSPTWYARILQGSFAGTRKRMSHLVASCHVTSQMARFLQADLPVVRIFLFSFYPPVTLDDSSTDVSAIWITRGRRDRKNVTTRGFSLFFCPFYFLQPLPRALFWPRARFKPRNMRGLTSTKRCKAVANSYISWF